MINSLELFSGAGGLAKGLELAGATHQAFVELNNNACKTLRVNYLPEKIFETDVKNFNFCNFSNIDLIAGGPPCQPFSIGGNHKGFADDRDLFPSAIQSIRQLAPKAFIFENVKGLLRKSFSTYFHYIILQLTYPEIKIKNSADWHEHLSELEKIHTKGNYQGVKYNVIFRLINAADFGVPQKRERVMIVGVRDDLNISWSFPNPTHSEESLLWSKYVTEEYWDKNKISPTDEELLVLKSQKDKLSKKYGMFTPIEKPWVTVRESIKDLPNPKNNSDFHKEHFFRDGARMYAGHTGSYIDEPSKTLKAGDHGVPGGENMIRFRDGSVRYFTILEAKRMQTFPDNYFIEGAWTEAMRQLGNAVPVQLGYIIGKSLIEKL